MPDTLFDAAPYQAQPAVPHPSKVDRIQAVVAEHQVQEATVQRRPAPQSWWECACDRWQTREYDPQDKQASQAAEDAAFRHVAEQVAEALSESKSEEPA